MKLPKALHGAAKVRMDYNENHDEKGRFSVSSVASGSAIMTDAERGSHPSKAAADAQAKSNSSKHSGLHTVYDNHTKAYVSSFRAGQEVPLKSAAKKSAYLGDMTRSANIKAQDKPANIEETRKAGQALRDLQAKNVAKDVKNSESPAGTRERLFASLPGGASGPVADTVRFHEQKAAEHRNMAYGTGGKVKGYEPAHLETARQHDVAAKRILDKHAANTAAKLGAPLQTNVVKSLNLKPGDVEKARRRAGGLKPQSYPDLSKETTESLLKTKEGFAKDRATKGITQENANTLALQGRHIDAELARRTWEAKGKTLSEAKNTPTDKANIAKSMAQYNRPNTPRTLSAQHKAPKGEPPQRWAGESDEAYSARHLARTGYKPKP